MRSSLRRRLQLWYALVLLAVIVSFAGLLYTRVRESRLREVDAQLDAAVHYLDAHLRSFPRYELEPLDLEFLMGDRPDEFLPPRREEDGPPLRNPPPFDGRPPRGGQPPFDGDRPPPRRDGPPRPVPAEPPSRERREQMLEGLKVPLPSGSAGTRRAEPVHFIVWRSDGTVVKSSWPDAPPDRPIPIEAPPIVEPLLESAGSYRQAILTGPSQALILARQSVTRVSDELRSFAWQLCGVGGVVLAIGLVGGWIISARIVRPIAAISATASSISAAQLSQRIDAESVDRELFDLAQVLNAMFDRIETAFAQQVRFTADASHELRTPLTVLRTQADLALLKPRTTEEYQAALATCQRAAGRMAHLVEGLLTLARADAGKLDLVIKPVDLKHLVEESIDLVRPLADSQQLSIIGELENVIVPGDAARLSQVVTNLLSNAIQYNRPGGEIRVRLSSDEKNAWLSVADTGVGIPPEHRPHLFERFYRADKARSRATGGSGLGLAISHSIVTAHGGTISLSSEIDRGTTFLVTIPNSQG